VSIVQRAKIAVMTWKLIVRIAAEQAMTQRMRSYSRNVMSAMAMGRLLRIVAPIALVLRMNMKMKMKTWRVM
jgi:hypothetical protein